MKNFTLRLLPLALFLISILSCSDDDIVIPTCENCNFTCLETDDTEVISNNCRDNWECNFIVEPMSKVDIDNNQGLTSGDKNVFKMLNSTQGSSVIADDEFTDILVFELDRQQDSFIAEGKQLVDMKVHFKTVCYCSQVVFHEVSSGCLQGEKKSDGTWRIQGDLNMPESYGDLNLKFDSQFVD